jgi:hypothetical protein
MYMRTLGKDQEYVSVVFDEDIGTVIAGILILITDN